ncbi:hypothetical protein SAMN05421780_10362 [Flexibacter flexilis DSM 6793]|uniref:Uncharacterized protein n=1 Tax=Flexibacter flexilis DSM 6793 TaxID=927664 RepID=A0A1I1GRJ1_9BACT|nr:DUF2147 domain-containing protein [Flexibacter flexilis]SFC14101.1 hypothetical protein SAMN05421780_10362 [Flexibacter flexilis DSM 6793]
MKTLIYMTILMVNFWFTANAHIATANPDTILGKWQNDDGRIIEFTKNQTAYDAFIVDAPDKKLIRAKQISGLVFDGNQYNNGTLYLIKKQKKVSCYAKIINDNILVITANNNYFSKSQTWHKVQ